MPQVLLVPQAPQEILVRLDLQEVLDQQVHKALQALQGLQEPLEQLVIQVQLVLPDQQGLQDLPVQLVQQVLTPQFQVQQDLLVLPDRLVQQALVLMRFLCHYSSVVCRIEQ